MSCAEVCENGLFKQTHPRLRKAFYPVSATGELANHIGCSAGAGSDRLTWGSSRSFGSMLRSLFCSRLCAPMHVLMRHHPDEPKARLETAPAGLFRAVLMLT
jgi:hypothetical protein